MTTARQRSFHHINDRLDDGEGCRLDEESPRTCCSDYRRHNADVRLLGATRRRRAPTRRPRRHRGSGA